MFKAFISISGAFYQPKPIQLGFFEGHEYVVISVAFSPDGKSVLTGSADNTAILWKTPQGIIDWLQRKDCPLRQLTEAEKVRFGIIEGRD